MDTKDKQLDKNKLAVTIWKILRENVQKDNPMLITSLRKLAAGAFTEYSIIQKIASGKKDPQFTTVCAIIEAFKLTHSEFGNYYDNIEDKEIMEFKNRLKKKSRKPH